MRGLTRTGSSGPPSMYVRQPTRIAAQGIMCPAAPLLTAPPELPTLLDQYREVRAATESICAPLEIEDHVVQPAPFVSPPKWHLAHSTWFFDRFVLQHELLGGAGRGELIADCNLLFNSYYKSQGQHWLQGERGQLSRPTVKEVRAYRHAVDARIADALDSKLLSQDLLDILRIGIHHEKQHQELLLMDIKYIFAAHPRPLAYDSVSIPPLDLAPPGPLSWLEFPETISGYGALNQEFAWDNEKPRHRRLLPGFQLASRPVTNGEYLAFIADGGYQRPELWLSDGWDWVTQHSIRCPLYWNDGARSQPASFGAVSDDIGRWQEYHLGGMTPLYAHLPVSHISYFEAEAYARWSAARLPTEFELEYFLHHQNASTRPAKPACEAPEAYWQPGNAVCPQPSRAADAFGNGLLWQWTASPYSPYPGFVPEAAALGEYNGKFMCNQFVLKGGCVATPRAHLRDSYRNFYRPSDRWMFSGIRLARDI